MKSAYELAMERLEKSAPTVQLTDAQKAQIAEIDSTYKARIAEKELFLQGKIREAGLSGTFEEVEKLEKQLATELRRLQEDCEEKKRNYAHRLERSRRRLRRPARVRCSRGRCLRLGGKLNSKSMRSPLRIARHRRLASAERAAGDVVLCDSATRLRSNPRKVIRFPLPTLIIRA